MSACITHLRQIHGKPTLRPCADGVQSTHANTTKEGDMPYSVNTFDDILVDQIKRLNPKSILDVGAGAGKNGRLLRQSWYSGTLDAVEPTEKYITEFNLSNTYNKVYTQSIEEYIQKNPTNRYDVAVFGDVLEHLFRSSVIDYLDYFLYRTRWVIIVWPTHHPQDDYDNNHYEVHRSNFNLRDLSDKFDVQYFVTRFGFDNPEPSSISGKYNYCVIKGHMVSQRDSIYDFTNWKSDLASTHLKG